MGIFVVKDARGWTAAVIVAAAAGIVTAQAPGPGPRPGPGLRAPASQPATGPAATRPLSPEVIAMFGGPSIEEQNLRALEKTLGCTPEEWKVILPLLQNVLTAAKGLETGDAPLAGPWGPRGGDWANGTFSGPGETASGQPMKWGGGGGEDASQPARPAPGADAAASPAGGVTLQQAMGDLKKLMNAAGASEGALQRQVAAVRAARHRAEAALAAAQAELLPLLTAKQEAMLVALGYLEE